jgi:hypothetical protein
MKTPWIGTSWKMNKTRAEAQAFAAALKTSSFGNVQPFVIPPFPYIAEVADILSGTQVKVGAQNMHWADQGAWTGEVSPLMVKDCGASIVELGHSERRTHFGETDETVAKKVAAAVRHGLTALVCIGDTRSEYEAGATADVLAKQTRFALRDVGRPTSRSAKRVCFASTSAVAPASYSLRVSPMQTSAVRPCLTAAATFFATVSSVSPKWVRRSLWPSSTMLAPQSFTIRGDTSPVQAPWSAQCMFCAPTFTCVPDRMSATSAI